MISNPVAWNIIFVDCFSSQLVVANKNRGGKSKQESRSNGVWEPEGEREPSRSKRGPGTGHYFHCVSYPRNISGFVNVLGKLDKTLDK